MCVSRLYYVSLSRLHRSHSAFLLHLFSLLKVYSSTPLSVVECTDLCHRLVAMLTRAAESQSESEDVSDPSQTFKPREDDDKTLYEVIEITGETKTKYKVRWKGNNPETKKPWLQSWVLKRDCTNDLVLIWKTEKKKQKERNNCKS